MTESSSGQILNKNEILGLLSNTKIDNFMYGNWSNYLIRYKNTVNKKNDYFKSIFNDF